MEQTKQNIRIERSFGRNFYFGPLDLILRKKKVNQTTVAIVKTNFITIQKHLQIQKKG